MRRELLAVAIGGAVGALARWSLSGLAPEDQVFPWATLAINVAGCFALALLPALPAVRDRALLLVALGPGLLGGFTTLSAYAEEARALVADGHTGLAAAYVVGTLGACLLAVALAAALTSDPGAWRSR